MVLTDLISELASELPESASIDQPTWSSIAHLISKAISIGFSEEMSKFDIKSTVDTSVKAYFDTLNSRIDNLEREVTAIKNEDLTGKITSLENSLQSYAKSVESVQKNTLPSLVDHFNCAVTAIALNGLDMNVHRRKFTLVVQGIKGKAKEPAEETRSELIKKVKSAMGIELSPSDFAACHRLDNLKPNSGIHARFVDLSKRDLLLSNARKLAKLPQKDQFSLSIDVPPCLRKVRKELADIRKDLPPASKKQSYIKNLPSFPYFELVTRMGDDVVKKVTKHSWSKQEIALASLPTMLAECASLNYNIPVKALPEADGPS